MKLLKGGDPAAALRNTTFIAAALFWAAGWFGIDYFNLETGTEPMLAVIAGSLVGILIGLVTEYYTGIEDVFGFKVKAIPAMFLLDRGGQVVAQWTGKIDYEQVEQAVLRRLEIRAEAESP